ncbi:hypothetical protein Scep_022641 [Stephania cephalantha]|uniref:Uncharacterized protein n=1 Tax=Stephania cephalantha TaxID=152367 RepID=A0AAP0FBN6_9MAGN
MGKESKHVDPWYADNVAAVGSLSSNCSPLPAVVCFNGTNGFVCEQSPGSKVKQVARAKLHANSASKWSKIALQSELYARDFVLGAAAPPQLPKQPEMYRGC